MVNDYLMFRPLKVGGRRVQVVDLFCGGGGFSEGALNAGATVVLSIDAWQPAVITHQLNHPQTPCLKFALGDSIPEAAALIRLYLKAGWHFHLHASPPCQALSNASNAKPEDGLGLVDWTLALIEYMKPDSWSLENVLPLGKYLKQREVPFEKLNAAHFGVPQLRKRVFAGEGWVAKESHSNEEFVSVLDALPHLNGELNVVNPGVIEEFRLESMGANAKRSRDSDLGEPSRTICGSGNQVGARIFKHTLNMVGAASSLSRRAVSSDVNLDAPSKTVTNQTPILRAIGETKAVRVRSLTLEETSTLQGWPGMKIPDTPHVIKKKEAWQIIGNMVCPPVAKAIMEGLK
jgi:site-specific DNA-cytosine methylase